LLVISMKRRSRARRHVLGFTLLELMVTVLILAVLAGLGTANFSSIIGATRVRAAALDLSSDLSFARSEAIKRNGDVAIARTGGEWAFGWSITASGGAVTLRTRNAMPVGISSSATATTFVFNGAGRVGGTGSITICPSSSDIQGRRVSIDTIGLARSEKLSCP
jgi:type IV fimbrial biogenesis protein FimT